MAEEQFPERLRPLNYFFRSMVVILGASFCLAGPLLSFAAELGASAGAKASAASSSQKHIPDVNVIDQNGRSRHFYTDLVKGRVVAINFVYTTCTTICPPLGATFGRLQKSLGAHFGKDVFLISISVDPAVDTPERLRSWAAQFGGKPGWTLVTGDKMEINQLLKSLGSDVASPESHSPMVLVINDRTETWKRVYGLGDTAALTRSIEEVMAEPRHQLRRSE
jgi:protein SCO1